MVSKLPENKATREILSPGEVKAFFKIEQTDPRYFVINLLAATTGLRLGERRGLQIGDIKDGFIEVRHNWQDKEGLKEPKWGSQRAVPLPVSTLDAINKLIEKNPYKNDFVFWGPDKDSPIGKWHISFPTQIAESSCYKDKPLPLRERPTDLFHTVQYTDQSIRNTFRKYHLHYALF
ncbi:MAG: site-specific integrase [Spirochaetales bacterium]|nr:site-specific integrase [Spirochaetales bacterium]